ncbi:MAG: arylsulfatase [Planctomycetota bacterium]|jgi:arylsulfatase A-like enzyme
MTKRLFNKDETRPNIVFILTDQWRGDCLSVLDHGVVDTPNIDELAHRGTLFTSAYAACPTCITARANIWTGQSPSRLGWLGFPTGVEWDFETTLMQELKNTGYQTACIGKTHFFPKSARLGFEHLESYEGYSQSNDEYVNDYDEWLKEKTNDTVKQADHGLHCNSWLSRPSHLPEELHNNTWVVTRALEFMRRRDFTRPFFLNLSFHRPHPPFDPPQAFFDMYKDVDLPEVPIGDWAEENDVPVKRVNMPQAHIPDKMLDRSRQAYFAQIHHIDMQIGRFIMQMRTLGLLNNTWFVFTSDHGEMLGDHHQFCKACAQDGSAKIPLVITPPTELQEHDGVIRCDKPVSHFDIMPTLLEATGAAIPESVEGKSLLPLCHEDAENVEWREFVHGEHSRLYRKDNAMQYVTDGREKFIWNPITGRELFFNLIDDPGERHDLSSDPAQQERVNFWRQRLIDTVKHRTEDKLTDGKKLTPGHELPKVRKPV